LGETVKDQSLFGSLERDDFDLVVKSVYYYCLMIADSIGEREQVFHGADH
jgi:hypothetical protein